MVDSILTRKLRTRILPDMGYGSEIPIIILVFTLHYFQEKLMTKFCKKSKKLCSGASLGPFYPNLDKNKFTWKKRLCQFLDIPSMYHHAKNQDEQANNYFWYTLWESKWKRLKFVLGENVLLVMTDMESSIDNLDVEQCEYFFDNFELVIYWCIWKKLRWFKQS